VSFVGVFPNAQDNIYVRSVVKHKLLSNDAYVVAQIKYDTPRAQQVSSESKCSSSITIHRTTVVDMDVPYTFPSICSYPPFFSRQPNAQTYVAQKNAWTSLILEYYRSKRLWRIDVNQETIEKVPIFSNKEIQRKVLGGQS
jgi:hypothetical protein